MSLQKFTFLFFVEMDPTADGSQPFSLVPRMMAALLLYLWTRLRKTKENSGYALTLSLASLVLLPRPLDAGKNSILTCLYFAAFSTTNSLIYAKRTQNCFSQVVMQ